MNWNDAPQLTSVEWHDLASRMPLCNKIPPKQRGNLIRGTCRIRKSKNWQAEGTTLTQESINLVAAHLALMSMGHPGEAMPYLRTIKVCSTVETTRLYRGARREGVMSLSVKEIHQTALGNKTRINPVVTEGLLFTTALTSGALVPLPPGSSSLEDWDELISQQLGRTHELDHAAEDTLVNTLGVSSKLAFLSVATQIFLEEPTMLYRRHRRLFTCLKHLYGLDPSVPSWEATGVEYGIPEKFVSCDTELIR